MNVQNISSIRSVPLDLDVNALESVAHNTWRDMMTWHVLEKLIVSATMRSVVMTLLYDRS